VVNADGLPTPLSFTVTNFVNVIGTNNNDTITGDTANNTLSGGGGNDSLNGGGGNDQIFGDINSNSPTFNYNGKSYLLSSAGTWTQAQAQAVSLGGNLVTVNDAAENQFLVNTFGNLNRWIGLTDEVVEGQFKWVNGEAVTYTNWIPGQPDNAGGNQDYVYIDSTQKRWDDFGIGTAQGIIEIQSNDTIIGSTGNDTINGGVGIDTANYSAIGQAITLLPTGTVNKGTAGIDQLIKVETIIGATGLINVIDNSSATGATTINANLGTQSLVVNADGLPTPLSFTVTNFVNVIGTNNNDTITGDTANNTLSGGGGNDSLNGGGGNDQIFGGAGNDFLAGNQDNDLLTGGLGNDIFATALGLGSDTIQDFQDGFDKIGLGGGLLFTQLGISQLGANTLIRNTSNAELLFTLQNVSSALITSADFVTV
jgi:Ca2+-binding RTX toxin-like protein